jgi:hypothetical protein
MMKTNATSIRKLVIVLLIFFALLLITVEAAHLARADDGYATPDQIMAPLDQGYDSESEIDTSFDNTWWCQEASCEIDYGAILGDPSPDPGPSDPPPSDPPPSDPPPSDPSDPLFEYCANLMGAPEYAQPCLDDPSAYGWRVFEG